MPVPFEIPVFSAAAAKIAVENGATRLEVNAHGSYPVGGLTPTLAEIRAIIEAMGAHRVPLRIMVRPVATLSFWDPNNFCYDSAKFERMQQQMQEIVDSRLLDPALGDGFVFGILERTADDEGSAPGLVLDVGRSIELVAAARRAGLPCVLHRAFDVVVDYMTPAQAMMTVRDIGFAGVLTSGGSDDEGAAAHKASLTALVQQTMPGGVAEGIQVIIGGGLRTHNVAEIAQAALMDAIVTWPAAPDLAKTLPVAMHSSCMAAVDPDKPETDEDFGEALSKDEVAGIAEQLRLLGL